MVSMISTTDVMILVARLLVGSSHPSVCITFERLLEIQIITFE